MKIDHHSKISQLVAYGAIKASDVNPKRGKPRYERTAPTLLARLKSWAKRSSQ